MNSVMARILVSAPAEPAQRRSVRTRWKRRYSTVTVFARLRGWSTLRPRRRAIS